MPQRFDVRRKDLLLGDERQEALQPEALLRTLGLKQGDTMADIGSGPGFFTVPAARIVGPDGIVIAADVQGEMLAAVRDRAAASGLTNVRVVKTSETEVPIPHASCDFILLAFTLHETENHASFLHRLARLLKPGGHIAVIEWAKHEHTQGPPIEDRIAPDELLADAQAAGLQLEQQSELNEHQYTCTFARSAVQ